MTPKEALDILRNRVSKLALNHKIGNRDIANLEVKDIVMSIETHVIPTFEQALTELEAIKRYPTSDEVCEALSEWYRCEIMHNNYEHDDINETCIRDSFYRVRIKKDMDDKPYKVRHEIVAGGSDGITMNAWLPLHLITLIGRFYEGLGKGALK